MLKNNTEYYDRNHNIVLRFLMSLFGIGYIRYVPGTWASLFGLFICFLIDSMLLRLAMLIVSIIFTGWMCFYACKVFREKDPKSFVLDEFVGVQLACFAFRAPLVIVFSFFAFRILDILKPFPIKQVDSMKCKISILADDVVAGIMANVLVRVIVYYFGFSK